MFVFLASLTVLFAPLLVVYALIRSQSASWPPPGLPPLPAALWLSTACLLLLSGVLHAAVSAARVSARARLRGLLTAALLLTLGFLANQTLCWQQLLSDLALQAWRVAGFFYFFTVIHALHVIGGIGPLVLVFVNALRGRYGARNFTGVRLCAMYWHFLDAVWVVMFCAMLWPSPAA